MKKNKIKGHSQNNKNLYNMFFLPKSIVEILLKDHSTNKNIIWSTTETTRGAKVNPKTSIKYNDVFYKENLLILPRAYKNNKEKSKRTRNSGEVFTPLYICNNQINIIDQKWFKKKNVFNKESKDSWKSQVNKIVFNERNWKDYVSDIRIEISCGEAPYITSRYDTFTGKYIELKNRIGILDRKLRIIDENTNSIDLWIKYAILATKSIYGFELQGDNLLLARINVIQSVKEHFKKKFNKKLNINVQKELADIISWNLWQMDALKCKVPYSLKKCMIKDWTTDSLISFKEFINER